MKFLKFIFKQFGIQIVGLFVVILFNRQTIWILDQYKRKQNGIHSLLGIQMVGLSGIQMAL